jgi:putative Mg2+ transporter-C (MgtC) family protein
MAQGIMTGIGFLGAGVIMKEGLAVRGLTTAASIWVTSAIGILFGIGFWIPAMLAVAATLGTLSSFRWIESRMPTEFYAQFRVQFRRADAMPEKALRDLVRQYGFSVANLNYVLTKDGERFEYRMVLRTLDQSNTPKLADHLGKESSVVDFRIAPIGS